MLTIMKSSALAQSLVIPSHPRPGDGDPAAPAKEPDLYHFEGVSDLVP